MCLAAEVQEGQPRRVELDGLPPLAVFCAEGRYLVTTDKCTHGLGVLSEGFQEGTRIECPLHGGVFDLCTGEALEFPCRLPVKTWPVHVEDGWICVAADSA